MFEVLKEVAQLIELPVTLITGMTMVFAFVRWCLQRLRLLGVAGLEKEIDFIQRMQSPRDSTHFLRKRALLMCAALGVWLMVGFVSVDSGGQELALLLRFLLGACFYFIALDTYATLDRIHKGDAYLARLRERLAMASERIAHVKT
jgi:hypothetical protein